MNKERGGGGGGWDRIKNPYPLGRRGRPLIVKWSKALPLILGRSLSRMACEKVASDLGLDGGFCWLLRFPPQITTG